MDYFTIGVVGIDGRIAYLRQNMWAAYKADATRYPSYEAAQEMARHWLDGQPDVQFWCVERVEG
jgi:hypothetical protein